MVAQKVQEDQPQKEKERKNPFAKKEFANKKVEAPKGNDIFSDLQTPVKRAMPVPQDNRLTKQRKLK